MPVHTSIIPYLDKWTPLWYTTGTGQKALWVSLMLELRETTQPVFPLGAGVIPQRETVETSPPELYQVPDKRNRTVPTARVKQRKSSATFYFQPSSGCRRVSCQYARCSGNTAMMCRSVKPKQLATAELRSRVDTSPSHSMRRGI